jgi:hypothetical protein
MSVKCRGSAGFPDSVCSVSSMGWPRITRNPRNTSGAADPRAFPIPCVPCLPGLATDYAESTEYLACRGSAGFPIPCVPCLPWPGHGLRGIQRYTSRAAGPRAFPIPCVRQLRDVDDGFTQPPRTLGMRPISEPDDRRSTWRSTWRSPQRPRPIPDRTRGAIWRAPAPPTRRRA